jgi:hypothetical protein
MSRTDMGVAAATTDSSILFENGVGRNRPVLHRLVLPGISDKDRR